MKKQIIIFSFIFISIKGYCQSSNDSIRLPSLNSLHLLSDEETGIDGYSYSEKLNKQSPLYKLKGWSIPNVNTVNSEMRNAYPFKEYFDKYDLGRFIPKPPGMGSGRPIVPYEEPLGRRITPR